MLYKLWADGQDCGYVNPEDSAIHQLKENNPDVEYLVLPDGSIPCSTLPDASIASDAFEQMNLFPDAPEVSTVDLLIEELAKVREENLKLQAENLKLRNLKEAAEIHGV